MTDAPKLLIEWSSPWQEFLTAIQPALMSSPARLAGEARTGVFPYQGMLASWVLEAGLLVAVIVLPARLAMLRPQDPPPIAKYDVIYYSGDELPQTEDAAGARAGRSGRAGGHQGFHRTQTIRVARGESLRERVVDAPRLKLPQSDSEVANLLAYRPIPGPAPTEGLTSSPRGLALPETAVAPTPEVQRDRMRAAAVMTAAVVPPSPSAPQRDMASIRVPGSQAIAVIPPPVSAPEQVSNFHSQLTLPAPAVVVPPPTQVARDLRTTGPGFGAGELQKQVVPPPAQMDNTSLRRTFNGLGNANVVPPPVQLNGTSPGTRTMAALDSPGVVPPPVQMSGGSSFHHRGGPELSGGSTVVPPPPTVSGTGSVSGLGRGSHGSGLGGLGDAGSLAAPPSNAGGSGGGTGVVVSSQPGSKVAVPGNGGAGSLAMSPSGGATPGLGGSGGGAGVVRGNGPGSGLSGEGSGTTKTGTGHGSDTMARAGISPYPGTGGAGTGTIGKPAMPGVSVQGGSNIITLPSFGADGSQPSQGRSTIAKNEGVESITVVGTSRSGGAFNFYGYLKGDKVYTIYIDTALGTAVMEYADPTSAARPYAEDLTAPQPMRADVPSNLKPSRLIIACVLDRSGILRNAQVLEAGGSEMTSKVLASLPNWKFHPVFRGNQPIEVNAILGFDIDTR